MIKLFKNILCPVDFSEYSSMALRYAAALAVEGEAQLIVYHSVPDLEQISGYLEGHYIQTVTEALLTNGREKLESFCAEVLPGGLKAEMRLRSGNPPEMIIQVAKEESADLIVMGTHGYSGYHRFLLGSVTNKVLHTAAVPVFTVCKPRHNFLQPDSRHPIAIRRILCPVDFEPNNHKIVELACSIARSYKSQIDFLHVARRTEAVDWFIKEDRCLKRLRDLVSPVQYDLSSTRFLIEAGEPSVEIIKAIERHAIDLTVMGHHTRKPVEEYLLGSVTKRVIPDAASPVLVVRSEADLIYSKQENFAYPERMV